MCVCVCVWVDQGEPFAHKKATLYSLCDTLLQLHAKHVHQIILTIMAYVDMWESMCIHHTQHYPTHSSMHVWCNIAFIFQTQFIIQAKLYSPHWQDMSAISTIVHLIMYSCLFCLKPYLILSCSVAVSDVMAYGVLYMLGTVDSSLNHI